MSNRDDRCCHINIQITSQGDVNIYNCPPSPTPPSPPTEPRTPPGGPGACVPLALGSKPKQSQRQKIDRLLASTPVPSALAASLFHTFRRFLAGRTPGNAMEAHTFARLQALSPDFRRLLSCVVEQCDGLPPSDRDRLLDPSLGADLDTPVTPDALADAFIAEVKGRLTAQPADDAMCDPEVPGLIRVFDPGPGENFTTQVRICRINGLRTANFSPFLNIAEYLPEELHQKCEPGAGSPPSVVCSVQKGNCPGHTSQEDQSCYRVLDVEPGQSVVLDGVNYFSTDTTVVLRGRGPLAVEREVEAHVCGDTTTPVTEVVNGQTIIVQDCRVRDRLRFQLPLDLPHGDYEFQVKVPNITGIGILGPFLFSNIEFLRVVVPSTARFRIASETLFCKRETSPASFGSDEVGLRFLTTGIRPDGTLQQLRHVEQLFGDVDSNESRSLSCVPLEEDDQPLAGLIATIVGYEIDNHHAYNVQVQGFIDTYIEMLKEQWAALAFAAATGPIFALLAMSGWGLLVGAIAVALVLVANIFISLWAPADLIIQDAMFLTMVDLAALTDGNYGPPPAAQYALNGIDVDVSTVDKGASHYLELRKYRSSAEDSEYHVTLRYTRVS